MTKRFFLSIFPLLILAACQNNSLEQDNAFPFAQQEATFWTNELQQITPLVGKPISVRLRRDASLQDEGRFRYKFDRRHRLTLYGSDAIGALHALYTFCETLGTTFDTEGAILPDSIIWDKVFGKDSTTIPRVRWRGIRQHVNFSMDISSYPIADVRTYLERLVRMRFNKLTIHSYPYQWYAEDVTGEKHLAGSFFYGCTHRCDRWGFLQQLCHKTNDSIFCIPEAESVYGDEEKRSDVAINWMQNLINNAHEVGLRVQFSVENRHFDVPQTVQLARTLADSFNFDDLEFITEEMGGWNDDVPYATQQIDTAAAAIQILESDENLMERLKDLKVGIYCVLPNRIGDLYRHAREVLPEHYITVLSQYASLGVAAAYPHFIRDAEDLAWTELYSWVEFDGQMYLQQNHVQGIEDLLAEMDATAPEMQKRSVLFNHWRTAENRTSFRFAAEATLSKRNRDDFYKDYAQNLCIEDTTTFLLIQHKMEELHAYNVERHGNIGFAAVDFWKRESQHTCYDTEAVQHSIEAFEDIRKQIADICTRTTSEAGLEYLYLLGNRVLCSRLYLENILNGLALRDIPRKNDGTLLASNRKKTEAICTKCIEGYEQMLRIYAQKLPDRGCLGTIVSIWNGPVAGMQYIRHILCGTPLEDKTDQEREKKDAPPLPAFQK